MDLADVYAQFEPAWDEFAKGNPEPAKAMYSHRDDATLANPFGPAVRGWDQVSKTLEYASSRFRCLCSVGRSHPVPAGRLHLESLHVYERFFQTFGF